MYIQIANCDEFYDNYFIGSEKAKKEIMIDIENKIGELRYLLDNDDISKNEILNICGEIYIYHRLKQYLIIEFEKNSWKYHNPY